MQWKSAGFVVFVMLNMLKCVKQTSLTSVATCQQTLAFPLFLAFMVYHNPAKNTGLNLPPCTLLVNVSRFVQTSKNGYWKSWNRHSPQIQHFYWLSGRFTPLSTPPIQHFYWLEEKKNTHTTDQKEHVVDAWGPGLMHYGRIGAS